MSDHQEGKETWERLDLLSHELSSLRGVWNTFVPSTINPIIFQLNLQISDIYEKINGALGQRSLPTLDEYISRYFPEDTSFRSFALSETCTFIHTTNTKDEYFQQTRLIDESLNSETPLRSELINRIKSRESIIPYYIDLLRATNAHFERIGENYVTSPRRYRTYGVDDLVWRHGFERFVYEEIFLPTQEVLKHPEINFRSLQLLLNLIQPDTSKQDYDVIYYTLLSLSTAQHLNMSFSYTHFNTALFDNICFGHSAIVRFYEQIIETLQLHVWAEHTRIDPNYEFGPPPMHGLTSAAFQVFNYPTESGFIKIPISYTYRR